MLFFFFQAEDGIRDLVRSRGLGDVYKRQLLSFLILQELKKEILLNLELLLQVDHPKTLHGPLMVNFYIGMHILMVFQIFINIVLNQN
mgnify:CR=1 FL=1